MNDKASDNLTAEIARLEEQNSKLKKALARVRSEVYSRYIPFEIQEEIRKALDG